MPTIFERLDTALSGNGAAGQLDGQIASLGSVAGTVGQLIQDPPSGIQDLLSHLGTVGLPDLSLGGDLPGTFSKIQAALPSDLSSVTGELSSRLTDLGPSLGEGLIAAVQGGLRPVLDIAKLLSLDLTCEQPSSSPNGQGSAGTGGGASGTGTGGGAAGAGGA